MEGDVPWPWWLGLIIVCTIIIVIAYAVAWAAGRADDDR